MPLSPEHVARLQWFEQHEAQVIDRWPDPVGPSNKLHLLNKAKGIHKPQGLDYATGIRVAYGEKYGDGPDLLPDGSWRLLYHMEVRANQDNPLTYATNVGLLNCMRDSIPIGVLHQFSKGPNRYRVFGLGLVTDFEGGYFVLEGPVTLAGDFRIQDENPPGIDFLKLLEDARNKTLAEVYRRRGQGRFREALLQAYDRKCAVTGCDIVELLEAAHILPHRGTASDFVQNGILLRADIHTLFDLGLLRIKVEDYSVVIMEQLRRDPYYEALHCQKLLLPRNHRDWPSEQCLRRLAEMISIGN